MPDQVDLANDIRAKVQALRDAIAAAQAVNLQVEPPIMLQSWLLTGKGMGGLNTWTIKPPKTL